MEAVLSLVVTFVILCGIDLFNNVFEGFLRQEDTNGEQYRYVGWYDNWNDNGFDNLLLELIQENEK